MKTELDRHEWYFSRYKHFDNTVIVFYTWSQRILPSTRFPTNEGHQVELKTISVDSKMSDTKKAIKKLILEEWVMQPNLHQI